MAKNIETDLNLNGEGRIINSPDPINLYDVANKNYVDNHFNFSFRLIRKGETLTIPENQQMIVRGKFRIMGKVIAHGQLVVER